MRARYLGFVLLVWFPGVHHGKSIKFNHLSFVLKITFQHSALLLITVSAQSAEQNCDAPKLDHGYFVPEQETYSEGTKLTYACDNGRKPAVEGWWGTSTCENGKWSPAPQCIGKCFRTVSRLSEGALKPLNSRWWKNVVWAAKEYWI